MYQKVNNVSTTSYKAYVVIMNFYYKISFIKFEYAMIINVIIYE